MKPIYDHTVVDRTPYTYLIGWSWLNTWYYGARWAEGCQPEQLFKEEKRSSRSYNTSSEYVDLFIEEHGQPDIVEVRRIFSTANEAINWESNVIRRLKLVKDPRFLNKKDPKGKFVCQGHSEKTKFKMKETHNSDEVREKKRAIGKEWRSRPEIIERWLEIISLMKKSLAITNQDPKVKKRRSDSAKEMWTRLDYREKMKEVNSNVETKENRSRSQREYWDIPGAREKHREIMKEISSRPEVKDNRSKAQKEVANRPGYREYQSQIQKEIANQPEVKAKVKERNATPEERLRRSEAMKLVWTKRKESKLRETDLKD